MVSTIMVGSKPTAVGIWVCGAAAADEDVVWRMASDACAAAAWERPDGGSKSAFDIASSAVAPFAAAGICPVTFSRDIFNFVGSRSHTELRYQYRL